MYRVDFTPANAIRLQNPRDDADCDAYIKELEQGVKRQCRRLSLKDDIKVQNYGYQEPGRAKSDKEVGRKKEKDSKSLSEIKYVSSLIRSTLSRSILLLNAYKFANGQKSDPRRPNG